MSDLYLPGQSTFTLQDSELLTETIEKYLELQANTSINHIEDTIIVNDLSLFDKNNKLIKNNKPKKEDLSSDSYDNFTLNWSEIYELLKKKEEKFTINKSSIDLDSSTPLVDSSPYVSNFKSTQDLIKVWSYLTLGCWNKELKEIVDIENSFFDPLESMINYELSQYSEDSLSSDSYYKEATLMISSAKDRNFSKYLPQYVSNSTSPSDYFVDLASLHHFGSLLSPSFRPKNSKKITLRQFTTPTRPAYQETSSVTPNQEELKKDLNKRSVPDQFENNNNNNNANYISKKVLMSQEEKDLISDPLRVSQLSIFVSELRQQKNTINTLLFQQAEEVFSYFEGIKFYSKGSSHNVSLFNSSIESTALTLIKLMETHIKLIEEYNKNKTIQNKNESKNETNNESKSDSKKEENKTS